MTFWIPWTIDLLFGIGLLVFFLIGLSDGSVSSFNMGLWAAILCGQLGVLWLSSALYRSDRETLATILASAVAVPESLAGLGFLAMIVQPGRWN